MTDQTNSYAYASPRFPVFYDAWVLSMFNGTHSDIAVYRKYLRSYPHRQVIVDLSTGTGRVVKELGNEFIHNSLEDAIVYGIDHSPPMIERASKTWTPKLPHQTQKWSVAAATDFSEALDGEKVDLLINSAGSISHLTDRHEVQLFLSQVKKVLRPETGVAAISVLTEMLRGPEVKEYPGEPGDPIEHGEGELILPCNDDGEGRSGNWHKSPTAIIWDEDGNVRTDSFSVELHTDGNGTVAWKENLDWSLAVFDEKAWAEDVETAGLIIAEIITEGDGHQRFYILKCSE